jgi:hypothetical protein
MKLFSTFPRALFLSSAFILLFSLTSEAARRDFYEIKIYRLKDASQEARMDNYLKEAYIPALHRAGISKVGVFKPRETDPKSENIIVVFTPYKSLQQFEKLAGVLEKDAKYQSDGNDYINAKHNNPPYERFETILLRAFAYMPQFSVPEYSNTPSERVYELRSYEGATEKIYKKKVEMFNEGGEIDLFKRVGFNPVFFGEVISGSTMPNLVYMVSFSDTKTHAERWDAFRNHPDWKVMSGLEEYKNTVSKITRYLLYPVNYSDI